MKTKTIYICVKVKVEIPEDVESVEDAVCLVVNELDYDQDGIKIVDTEIMGTEIMGETEAI